MLNLLQKATFIKQQRTFPLKRSKNAKRIKPFFNPHAMSRLFYMKKSKTRLKM